MCEDCYTKLPVPKKCPQCRVAFHPCRARGMEALVERHFFPCEHGCGFTAKPTELVRHQRSCDRAPVQCPIGGCEAAAQIQPLKLKEHLMQAHSDEYDRDLETRGAKFETKTFFEPRNESYVHLFPGAINDGIYIVWSAIEKDEWHVQIFHFVKQRKFVCTLGDEGGRQIAFTDVSDNIREWRSSDSAEQRGFCVKKKKLETALDWHDGKRIWMKYQFG